MLKSLRIIGHLIRKEFIQAFRDHQMLGMMFIMPVIQVLLLGYAITVDVRDLSLGVMDYDRSPESRQLVEDFRHNETFDLDRVMSGPDEIRDALDRGEVAAVLVIPRGFARRLGRNESVDVQLLLDGVDSNASLIAFGGYSHFSCLCNFPSSIHAAIGIWSKMKSSIFLSWVMMSSFITFKSIIGPVTSVPLNLMHFASDWKKKSSGFFANIVKVITFWTT